MAVCSSFAELLAVKFEEFINQSFQNIALAPEFPQGFVLEDGSGLPISSCEIGWFSVGDPPKEVVIL